MHTCNNASLRYHYRFSRSLKGTSEGQDLDLDAEHYVFIGVGNTPQSKATDIKFMYVIPVPPFV